jgi:DNA-binding transcriptional regulator YbjK
MSSRRDVLSDAAIQVLGERGVRAVTHRAVDGEAGVAAGSTANYLPTRDALLDAIVERVTRRRARQLRGSRVPDVPAVAG